jgi:hypothetical protein
MGARIPPHIRARFRSIEAHEVHRVDSLPVALILNQFGLFLNARGAYAKAEPLCQRALAIREKALGAGAPRRGAIPGKLRAPVTEHGHLGDDCPRFLRAVERDELKEQYRQRLTTNVLSPEFSSGRQSQPAECSDNRAYGQI